MCLYSDGILEQLTCNTILPQVSKGSELEISIRAEHDLVSVERPAASTSKTNIICNAKTMLSDIF